MLFQENPLAIAIVSPTMQRAHQLESASEIVFLDSTSSCDGESHSVTFLLTASPCGAAPLGVIITESQDQKSYEAGLSLLKEAVGDRLFGGQGHPDVFMTDDSATEKATLRALFPESDQKLCLFHVLQALWRWLWESSHGVSLKEDRQLLMNDFKVY